MFITFGHEWRKDRLGLSIEDFFTFAEQKGSHYGYNSHLDVDFFEANCIMMFRAAIHFNDYICLSAGVGIGCNISAMEFEVNGYYSGYDNDMCITVCANLDARFTVTPTKNFGIDIGVNNVFCPERKYSGIVKLKGGVSSLPYAGVHFMF